MSKKQEQLTPYQKWYQTHKEEFAARRKLRYKNDPVYRESIRERQARSRIANPRQAARGEPSLRNVGGAMVEVFRIGALSSMIGRAQQTIRKWEEQGVIPTPSIRAGHRYYTKNQVMLLKELVELVDELRYDRRALAAAFEVKSKEIHKTWGG